MIDVPGKRGCFLLPEALSVSIRAGALYRTSGSIGSTSVYTCRARQALHQQHGLQDGHSVIPCSNTAMSPDFCRPE